MADGGEESDTMYSMSVARSLCWQEDASARPDASHVGLVLDLIHGRNGDVGPNVVMAILNGVLDNAKADQNIVNVDKGMPYMCKWPGCPLRFETLDSCIEHECAEFRQRSAKKRLAFYGHRFLCYLKSGRFVPAVFKRRRD